MTDPLGVARILAVIVVILSAVAATLFIAEVWSSVQDATLIRAVPPEQALYLRLRRARAIAALVGALLIEIVGWALFVEAGEDDPREAVLLIAGVALLVLSALYVVFAVWARRNRRRIEEIRLDEIAAMTDERSEEEVPNDGNDDTTYGT